MVDSVIRNPGAMTLVVKLKQLDDYSYSRSLGTSIWCATFGRHLGLEKSGIESLALGGLLLDVGKSSIPRELLQKPEKLSPEETTLVRAHVDNGIRMLSSSSRKSLEEKLPMDVLQMVATHHERADGKPIGAEALVRWESPSRGLCPPNLFLPVAESTGFIKPLTIWMLNSALRLSSQWTKQWGEQEVSVNIPPQILEQADFHDIVMSAWELWKPADVRLCLEILEQSFTRDTESIFAKLRTLRNEGIRIAIDDFGTGYSSLSYFRDIPADQLKIDRSFVAGLLGDHANANIVTLIIDLAHRFNLTVVAEGVEDMNTLATLKKMKCDSVQGFFFAKPMPADEFEQWLSNYNGINRRATDTAP